MVGIIILNYNNSEDTINCIQSILEYNTYPVKILVVDNGSTKQQCVADIKTYIEGLNEGKCYNQGEKIPSILPKNTFYISKSNDGYAQGNNKGLDLMYKDDEIDKILILNNDVLFYMDIIPKLVEFYDSRNDVGIVSPILYKKDKKSIDYNCARRNCTLKEQGTIFMLLDVDLFGIISKIRYNQQMLRNNPQLKEADYFEIELPSGSCMLIDKVLFKTIDSFDSNTFLYFEENILYKKIQKFGKKNFLMPKLGCVHLGASTMKKSVSSFTMIKGLESSMYYAKTYSDDSKLSYLFFLLACKMYKVRYYFIKLRDLLK